MKRLAVTLLAAAIGLLTAWLMSGVGNLIDWPVRSYHGCYEIDACKVPWWIVALFVAWIIGPAVVYASIAYVGMGRCWSPGRWVAVSLGLFLITDGLYVAWFAYRAFA